jgi:tetratricopeptide (TPR) repeat protein
LRITAQLIDARDDIHLWAQSYERELGEILDVQDSVALDVATQVKANLTPTERQSLTSHSSIKPEAYEAYVRGRNELTRQRADAMMEGIRFFERAIELEPLYTRAYAGLADAYSLAANYGAMSTKSALPRAKAAALKALELDPTLGEAHAALGFVRHHLDWDWTGAEAEYKRSIELASSYPLAHLRYAEFLSNSGRHDEALREVRLAEELDPLSVTIESNVGRILYYARRYDEAIRVLQGTLLIHPERGYTHMHLGMSYEQKQMYPQAISEFETAEKLLGFQLTALAHCHARAGRVDEARQELKRLELPAVVQDWFFIAAVYAALGDKNAALVRLERAHEDREFFMTYINVYPGFDPLRADPRFQQILLRVRVPR